MFLGDLIKAREKETLALEESDLQSVDDEQAENIKKRKRRPSKKLMFSSSEEDDEDELPAHKRMIRGLPKPPNSVIKKTVENKGKCTLKFVLFINP